MTDDISTSGFAAAHGVKEVVFQHLPSVIYVGMSDVDPLNGIELVVERQADQA
jgi:hypothetical protein